ncbi:MAG: hypothetical protein RLZZ124_744, partial [Cyanobacteriota bacterium]
MAAPPLSVSVLGEAQRRKLDESDDALFYTQPRFVHHLDGAFRSRLTRLYREHLKPQWRVLDLMSSWVSHLPEDVTYTEVIGHGLNADELAANPRLRARNGVRTWSHAARPRELVELLRSGGCLGLLNDLDTPRSSQFELEFLG